jgi:hypothetical protein
LNPLKRALQQFKDGKPGDRFQTRYWERRQAGHSRLRKAFTIAAGVLVVLVGLVLLPAPGPGMIVVAIGAGSVAQESLVVARALDRVELKLRSLYRHQRR